MSALSGRIWCDDSAAAIGAGGLVPRRETRIVMAKEVLKISPSAVQVDYDFRNDSDQDVTTEVAFPIPPYANGPEEWPANQASFSGFQLSVNNKPVVFQTEARAFLGGREITSILAADKIDIPNFGNYDWKKDVAPEFSRLPKSEQNKLVKLGLFDPDEPWGNWKVHLQYHWTQAFPAHSTVHIHHEYTPVEGFEMMSRGAIRKALRQLPASTEPWDAASKWDVELLNSFCPDTSFLHALEKSMASAQAQGEDSNYAHPHWVDFVLTSANTWKQPIEDFTLIVERGASYAGEDKSLVSFCSPQHAEVKKLNESQFQVHVTNLIPTTELRIGFFDLPLTASGRESDK
jgi:hypothetical protein